MTHIKTWLHLVLVWSCLRSSRWQLDWYIIFMRCEQKTDTTSQKTNNQCWGKVPRICHLMLRYYSHFESTINDILCLNFSFGLLHKHLYKHLIRAFIILLSIFKIHYPPVLENVIKQICTFGFASLQHVF